MKLAPDPTLTGAVRHRTATGPDPDPDPNQRSLSQAYSTSTRSRDRHHPAISQSVCPCFRQSVRPSARQAFTPSFIQSSQWVGQIGSQHAVSQAATATSDKGPRSIPVISNSHLQAGLCIYWSMYIYIYIYIDPSHLQAAVLGSWAAHSGQRIQAVIA